MSFIVDNIKYSVGSINFMIMNRIYNGKDLLEKVLTETKTLQSVFDKEQY